jgi:2-amino-4-hydroxy-6-hydroxymethyldihydropteridine diphosphokinase
LSRSPLRAYVGMGSNLGDRAGNLLLGVRGMLVAGLSVLRLSSVYETEPVGVEDAQPAFLNMAAELTAPLPPPEELLALLLRVEHALGRRRDRPLAARTLDLDLLLYGDVQTPLRPRPARRTRARRAPPRTRQDLRRTPRRDRRRLARRTLEAGLTEPPATAHGSVFFLPPAGHAAYNLALSNLPT